MNIYTVMQYSSSAGTNLNYTVSVHLFGVRKNETSNKYMYTKYANGFQFFTNVFNGFKLEFLS